jgi:hypothetical protein
MTAPATRTCVHCVLARALRAESAALSRAGLSATLRRSEPVTLPHAGAGVYREIRALLREAASTATVGPIRLALLDLRGKWCVEVTATVQTGRRTRVFVRAFPRHAAGALDEGFLEGLAPA